MTSAKAQNAQKTSAWATPASGRSRITLACSIDLPDEIANAPADGER